MKEKVAGWESNIRRRLKNCSSFALEKDATVGQEWRESKRQRLARINGVPTMTIPVLILASILPGIGPAPTSSAVREDTLAELLSYSWSGTWTRRADRRRRRRPQWDADAADDTSMDRAAEDRGGERGTRTTLRPIPRHNRRAAYRWHLEV